MPFGSDYGSLADLPANLGRAILNAGQTMLSAPRQAAWDIGPTLVGRSGQGPQSGAEALQRLGLDYNSPGQRALGHGLGAGLDMTADPLMLSGMGFGRAAGTGAAAPEAGTLTRRLERMVAPVAEANAGGAPIAQARIDNWMQGVGHPPVAFAPGAGGPLANAGALPRPLAATVPAGGGGPVLRAGSGARGSVDPATFGYDTNAMRALQLNSPNFNPASPAFGLGTGQFTQDASHAARMGVGEYNPLTTSSLLSVQAPTPAANQLMDRLRRLTPPPRQGLGAID